MCQKCTKFSTTNYAFIGLPVLYINFKVFVSSSVFGCHCRLLEDQGRAEEAAEHREGVLASRITQGGCLQPNSRIHPRPPELGESNPTLHELVQQALTLNAHTWRSRVWPNRKKEKWVLNTRESRQSKIAVYTTTISCVSWKSPGTCLIQAIAPSATSTTCTALNCCPHTVTTPLLPSHCSSLIRLILHSFQIASPWCLFILQYFIQLV